MTLGPTDMKVVRDFVDAFPKDLLGIPPKQEVEFSIDLMSRTSPISKTLYRMTPAEYFSLGCTNAIYEKERRFNAVVHRLLRDQ